VHIESRGRGAHAQGGGRWASEGSCGVEEGEPAAARRDPEAETKTGHIDGSAVAGHYYSTHGFRTGH
ncbi:hypothetical protein EV177_010469, partial [Coemansia sp. RSA 1804]